MSIRSMKMPKTNAVATSHLYSTLIDFIGLTPGHGLKRGEGRHPRLDIGLGLAESVSAGRPCLTGATEGGSTRGVVHVLTLKLNPPEQLMHKFGTAVGQNGRGRKPADWISRLVVER